MRYTLLAIVVAVLLVPARAHAACLSTTPGDWTVADPAGDQLEPGDTDISALHVTLDKQCRLTMAMDLNGGFDEHADSVWYGMDIGGNSDTYRGAIVLRDRPDRPEQVGRQASMNVVYDGRLQPFGPTGWTGTLDALEIAGSGTYTLRAYVSEGPPRGGSDSVAPLTLPIKAVTTADVPDDAAAPTIAGPAESGGTLNCAPGNWHGVKPITFAYRWLRDGMPIADATTPLYTTTTDDVTHLVTCQVTATNAAGSADAASAGILVTPPRPPVIRFVVVRTGTRTTVRYQASEQARVAFTVKRAQTTVGAFARHAHRGFNRVRLHHVATAGRYELLARPRDRVGHRGHTARLRFSVS